MKTQSFITSLLHYFITFFSITPLLYYSITLLLFSCSPQTRLQRLVAHHPELKLADTLLIRDTIIRSPVVADTALSIMRLTDTVTISRARLEIKLVRINDTIHIKGKCKADTIVRELRIPVEKIKLVKAEAGWLSKIPWIIMGIIVIVIVSRFRFQV